MKNELNRGRIEEYLLSLVGDLQNDMKMLNPVAAQISEVISRSNQLAEYVNGKTLDEINNIDLYIYIGSPSYRPFEWNRAAMDQLKNSGALRQIKDQELVKAISGYDALTRHLDQDYSNDENNIREAVGFALGVVNRNYPDRALIEKYFDEDGVFDFAGFFNSGLYQQMKSRDLPLLTREIKDIWHVVNTLILIGGYLDARVDIEFPRLRANAQDIIGMIETEYLR